MDVVPSCENIEKFRGGTQWYVIESKSYKSTINLILENEENQMVSVNGQNITF